MVPSATGLKEPDLYVQVVPLVASSKPPQSRVSIRVTAWVGATGGRLDMMVRSRAEARGMGLGHRAGTHCSLTIRVMIWSRFGLRILGLQCRQPCTPRLGVGLSSSGLGRLWSSYECCWVRVRIRGLWFGFNSHRDLAHCVRLGLGQGYNSG